MASLSQRFAALQRENPKHSSLINFGRAIEGQPLTKQRVVFYFKRLVDAEDYEKEAYRELVKWLCLKTLTQKQGFFDEKHAESALKSPTLHFA